MTWTLTKNEQTPDALLNTESLFSLGNGYLGIRGNFEEGYREDILSIRGAYLNAFHDVVKIEYGEKLFAFPETQQKLVNVIDSQTVHIYFGEEEEPFSIFQGEVLSFQRSLHLDKGYAERVIHWRSPKGKEVKLHFRRLVSFVTRELFAIDIQIESINFTGTVKIISSTNGDVSNYVNTNDPRVGTGHAKRLQVEDTGLDNDITYVIDRTYTSKLQTACFTRHQLDTNHQLKVQKSNESMDSTFTFDLTKSIHFTKYNVYTDTLRHGQELSKQGIAIQQKLRFFSFENLLDNQKKYLDDFWVSSDVTITGDERLQEGIRFNLFQLLQSVSRDRHSNISAKGLSGEGYEGHYFWDTEIYMFPIFLSTNPEIAKQLLIYRYSTLPQAKERAKEMGHRQGALFPWRTISGEECSSFFPSGTAQYHISADIAYSYVQYYLSTKDTVFLQDYGAEVLFETARLWIEIGHEHNGKFLINDVTGPDEYTCIVNNNYYTNLMAQHNLKWAAKAFHLLADIAPVASERLCEKLQVTKEEVNTWQKAADSMYLPYDASLQINPQDDSFLQKQIWDFEHTPREHYPLLLHYHPLTIYRYQVCKQADTVLAHFLLEDEQSVETIKNSYDYYEKITTHDSSLSTCIFSIMANKVGYRDKAYNYFNETVRLDLDNTHGNTKDGLHLANMGGTWLSIVYGFGGFRLKEDGISLAPYIPSQWSSYAFRVQYCGAVISVEINHQHIHLTLLTEEEITIKLYEEQVLLRKGNIIQKAIALESIGAAK